VYRGGPASVGTEQPGWDRGERSERRPVCTVRYSTHYNIILTLKRVFQLHVLPNKYMKTNIEKSCFITWIMIISVTKMIIISYFVWYVYCQCCCTAAWESHEHPMSVYTVVPATVSGRRQPSRVTTCQPTPPPWRSRARTFASCPRRRSNWGDLTCGKARRRHSHHTVSLNNIYFQIIHIYNFMVTCTTILTSSSKNKIYTKICKIYIWKKKILMKM